ncbi:MAG: hypothetical protein ACRD2G_02005, partial [Terriglobia bacterium]
MTRMTRRDFVATLALGSASAALGRTLHGQETPEGVGVSITVHSENSVAAVPQNYSGLSYEAAQLAHPGFFAPTNKALIAFFRRLTKQGVLRIGGNTSEFTVWSPAGAPAGAVDAAGVGPDAGGAKPPTPAASHAVQNPAHYKRRAGRRLRRTP